MPQGVASSTDAMPLKRVGELFPKRWMLATKKLSVISNA
jgi:hypothetical protein